MDTHAERYDFVVIGSGFGGSVSALRLAEKGHRVLVLERGRRFRDEDFARSTWRLRRYLWAPALRCFGILQISPFRDVVVLHGARVGGGSLGYANVLMPPGDAAFDTPAWRRLADWKTVLAPHFATARRMLGVATNPRLGPADAMLREIAEEMGVGDSFRAAPVGTFFGEPGREGEEVLATHPAVQEVGVAAVPDAVKGERPKAWVVLRPGASATPDELRAHCEAHLAGYKVPAAVAIVGELPKSAIGKVLRRKLRELDTVSAAIAQYVPAATPVTASGTPQRD